MSTPTLPDLTSPEAADDLPGILEHLREVGGSAPASFGGAPARLFVDDADARTILSDRRTPRTWRGRPPRCPAPTSCAGWGSNPT